MLQSHSTGIFTTLMEPPLLPVAGTYQFMVDPAGSGTGRTALTLYELPADISGPITPGGSAVTVTTTVPGQNGRLTFTGAGRCLGEHHAWWIGGERLDHHARPERIANVFRNGESARELDRLLRSRCHRLATST